MRIVLSVSSSSEYCDGGCEFALVDLTADLAALALRRVGVLKEQKCLDRFISETYYWDYSVQYFSPWAGLANAEEGEATGLELLEMADGLQNGARGFVAVPENFGVPPSQLGRVECQQMIVCQESIRFIAIPKHASFYVQTAEIPILTLEAATVPPARG